MEIVWDLFTNHLKCWGVSVFLPTYLLTSLMLLKMLNPSDRDAEYLEECKLVGKGPSK